MFRSYTLVIVAITFIYAIEGVSFARDSIDKICKPVNCKGTIKKCPYGYQKHHGCEICRCYDPCNPPGKAILCGTNQRCFIDKKPSGIFVARCGASRSKRNSAVCEEEKVVGFCKAAFPRFYYNSTMKTCVTFIYGGCGGNENNFETEDECAATCIN